MVITDFKLRYQGSALGYLWSLLRPLFLFVILYIVFAKFFRFGEGFPHFPVYLLTGIVLWNFFAEVTNNGVSAIVGRSELIRKLNFPRYVIILSGAFSALINLALNMVVISIFLAVSGVELRWSALLAPFILFELFVFAMAAAFILSAVYVKLRDINYVWEVIMQGLFYATPIIYPVAMVSDRWPEAAKILLLSPIAQSIQDFRYAVITPGTDTLWTMSGRWWVVALPFLLVMMTLIVAVVYFKKRSPHFAEEV
jgi:ABC-2 type transport system permease protein